MDFWINGSPQTASAFLKKSLVAGSNHQLLPAPDSPFDPNNALAVAPSALFQVRIGLIVVDEATNPFNSLCFRTCYYVHYHKKQLSQSTRD